MLAARRSRFQTGYALTEFNRATRAVSLFQLLSARNPNTHPAGQFTLRSGGPIKHQNETATLVSQIKVGQASTAWGWRSKPKRLRNRRKGRYCNYRLARSKWREVSRGVLTIFRARGVEAQQLLVEQFGERNDNLGSVAFLRVRSTPSFTSDIPVGVCTQARRVLGSITHT